MHYNIVLEGSNDDQKSGGGLENVTVTAADPLGARHPFRAGQVRVAYLGRDGFARTVDGGKVVQTRVRNLNRSKMHFGGAARRSAGVRLTQGERIEKGRFARLGQSDDYDIHIGLLRSRCSR